MPIPTAGSEPVHHLLVVNHPEVGRAKQQLSEHGIGWGEHYPRAVHLQPAFSRLGSVGEFPIAEAICSNILSLPMYAELEDSMVRRVCEVLLRVES